MSPKKINLCSFKLESEVQIGAPLSSTSLASKLRDLSTNVYFCLFRLVFLDVYFGPSFIRNKGNNLPYEDYNASCHFELRSGLTSFLRYAIHFAR